MKKFFIFSLLGVMDLCFSQTDSLINKIIVQDTLSDVVIISASRELLSSEAITDNVNRLELKNYYFSQAKKLGYDIPVIAMTTPSVVSSSDTGNNIGYTNLRLRGSDQSRINVTLNGVPVNDAEGQGVFWVNLPDLSANVSTIVLERGLGSSTNGAASFGGNLAIKTIPIDENSNFKFTTAFGSFGTNKLAIFGSTPLSHDVAIAVRGARIHSDGYIDRASSDLYSFGLDAAIGKHLEFNMYGGIEKTYQAWYGIDSHTLQTNRTYNPAGEIYNDLGEVKGFYDNQVDDYQQYNYQLHYKKLRIGGWKSTLTAHYTYGKGYYEEYKNGAYLPDYLFTNNATSDLVRRKWLKNHFYGLIFSTNKRINKEVFNIGATVNSYRGDHFGKVIQIADTTIKENIPKTYYDNLGVKTEWSAYVKWQHENLVKNVTPFLDLQMRQVFYTTSEKLANTQEAFMKIDENLFFFNPKVGVKWLSEKHQFSAYYGLGHREPSRDDYMTQSSVKPEQMQDIELTYQYQTQKITFKQTLYGMFYKDQLVLSGAVNDVGSPIRENSGKSYRIGVEWELNYSLSDKITIGGNATLSSNKNNNYITEINNKLVELGKTTVSYSPTIIAMGYLSYEPLKRWIINLNHKYVGSQYMSNANYAQSKLAAFSIANLTTSYQLPSFYGANTAITLSINNLYDTTYESNGYYFNYYDGNTIDIDGLNHNPYYYPQAGRNYMVGIEIKF